MTNSFIPDISVRVDHSTGRNSHGCEKLIKGIPVSPGVSFAHPCFYREIKTGNNAGVKDKNFLTGQQTRLIEAFNQLGKQLLTLAKKAEDNSENDTAAIFRAHKMICEEVQVDILNTVKCERLNAISAVEKCFDEYSEYFNGLNNEYFSERGNDFTELKQLLLNLLNNTESFLSCKDFKGCQAGECVLGNEHILVVDELTANVAIRIRGHTKGIITEKCGTNSHAAVIARSLDIPVISGIKDPGQLLSYNDNILINGATGELIINPENATLAQYRTQINRPSKSYEVVEPVPQFTVLADIDRYHDVRNANRVQADGIGIYRTEFEMLSKGRELSEDEQTACYQHVVDSMEGRPVYFRLFDLGSDKSAPWLGIPAEDNPALGCRGARFLLSRPEIVKRQARAIARSSRSSPVHVIYPMISGLEQFLWLKKIFLDAVSGIDTVQIHHGIMFEVPAACMQAEELYQVIDFGRIGSNDLIQYLLAFDRTRDDFCYHELAADPAVWKIINNMAVIARRAKKPLELCGAMAAYPEFIPKIIELGIRTISTGPEYIAGVRKIAASCFS